MESLVANLPAQQANSGDLMTKLAPMNARLLEMMIDGPMEFVSVTFLAHKNTGDLMTAHVPITATLPDLVIALRMELLIVMFLALKVKSGEMISRDVMKIA